MSAAEIEGLKAENKIQAGEIEKQKEALEATKAKLESKISDLQSQQAAAEESNSKLEAALGRQEAAAKAGNQQSADEKILLEKEIGQLRAAQETAAAQVEASKAAIASLKEAKDAEIAELKSKLDEQIAANKVEIAELSASLQEEQQKSSAAKLEAEAAKRQADLVQSEITELGRAKQAVSNELTAKAAELERAAEEAQGAAEILLETVVDLSNKLDSMREQNNGLTAELEQYRKIDREQQEARAQKERLAQEAKDAATLQQREKLIHEITELISKIESSRSHIETKIATYCTADQQLKLKTATTDQVKQICTSCGDRCTEDVNAIILEYLQTPVNATYLRVTGTSTPQLVDVGSLTTYKADLEAYNLELINTLEDLNGSVRVFVRVSGAPLMPDTSAPTVAYTSDPSKPLGAKMLTMTGGGGSSEESYGPYYDTFLTETNPQIYDRLKSTFEQIKQGYHLVFFGYGFSGSGKTFTLINASSAVSAAKEQQVYGVIIMALNEFFGKKTSAVQFVKLHDAYELYSNSFDVNKEDSLYDVPPLAKNLISYTGLESFAEFNRTPNLEKFIAFLKEINDQRIAKERIKQTVNNPESSRGHLFFTLKIGDGYITVCDMGGRENPEDIWANSTLSIPNSKGVMTVHDFFGIAMPLFMSFNGKGYLRTQVNIRLKEKGWNLTTLQIDDVMEQLKFIQETCKEGFFINETLNMLRWFFQNRRGFKPDQKFGMYHNVATQAQTAETYRPDHFALKNGFKFNDWKTQIGMIDLLTKLDQLKSSAGEGKTKPTKFIMFACVRKEASEVFKTASENTLKFAMGLTAQTQTAGVKGRRGGKKRTRRRSGNGGKRNQKFTKRK